MGGAQKKNVSNNKEQGSSYFQQVATFFRGGKGKEKEKENTNQIDIKPKSMEIV